MIDLSATRRLIGLLCALPLADIVVRALLNLLGANPQEAILRGTGLWCLTLLLVTLSVTPLRQVLKWPELVQLRRMLGLWTFAYAMAHLLAFWAFEHDFEGLALLKDGIKRPFVTVGLLAFVLLLPLAATSHQAAVRRLGPNWKRLHRLVYAVGVLACIHFFLHRAGKSNFADPLIATGCLALVLGMRIYPRR